MKWNQRGRNMKRYMKSMPYNMIHLCIDRYDGYQISGRAYTPTLDYYIDFADLNELFLKLDHVFDKNGNPVASQSMRSFQKPEKAGKYQASPKVVKDYMELLGESGKELNVDIVVKSRRKSSWQGILFYQEEGVAFDTILELIHKILELFAKDR